MRPITGCRTGSSRAMMRSPANPNVIPVVTHRASVVAGLWRAARYQLQPASTNTPEEASRLQVGIRRLPSPDVFPSRKPPKSSRTQLSHRAASHPHCHTSTISDHRVTKQSSGKNGSFLPAVSLNRLAIHK
jgi:hypothetical protein